MRAAHAASRGRDAVDVLHRDEQLAVDLTPTSWTAIDVRMRELGDRAGLVAQLVATRRAARPSGDAAIELGVVGRVDDAHAAGAEPRRAAA